MREYSFQPSPQPSNPKILLIQLGKMSPSHYEGYPPLSPVHLWAENHSANCIWLGSGRILNPSEILITSSQSGDYYATATRSKPSVPFRIPKARWNPRFWPTREVESNSLFLQTASPTHTPSNCQSSINYLSKRALQNAKPLASFQDLTVDRLFDSPNSPMRFRCGKKNFLMQSTMLLFCSRQGASFSNTESDTRSRALVGGC